MHSVPSNIKKSIVMEIKRPHSNSEAIENRKSIAFLENVCRKNSPQVKFLVSVLGFIIIDNDFFFFTEAVSLNMVSMAQKVYEAACLNIHIESPSDK